MFFIGFKTSVLLRPCSLLLNNENLLHVFRGKIIFYSLLNYSYSKISFGIWNILFNYECNVIKKIYENSLSPMLQKLKDRKQTQSLNYL